MQRWSTVTYILVHLDTALQYWVGTVLLKRYFTNEKTEFNLYRIQIA